MKFPYAEIQMTTAGTISDRAELDRGIATVLSAAATDVLVLVHGWQTGIEAARGLYGALTDNIDLVRPPAPGGPTIAVIGILWPSITWGDLTDIAGGGAGLGSRELALAADVHARVEDAQIAATLAGLVPKLDVSAQARAEYLDALRSLLPADHVSDEDPPSPTLLTGDAEEVFALADVAGDGLSGDDLAGGAQDVPAGPAGPGDGGLDGGAAAFGFGDVLGAARNLLNLTTYYTMKDRSGAVGRAGIATALEGIHTAASVRLHLVGHSFGARAATQAVAATSATVSSLSLLQGAFSHFGMATDWDGHGDDGLFQGVPDRLAGPLLVTYTRHDLAVGLAYAVASRIARQTAAGVGGPDDPYGGLGRNGALKTANSEMRALLAVSGVYDFAPKRVENLNADAFISGHGDVTGPEVAHAVWSAIDFCAGG